jgi:hypothetical protein
MMRGAADAGVDGIEVTVASDRRLTLNGQSFPVVANEPFQANFEWHVDSESDGTGYAAIIFAGPDGKERHRVRHWLQTSWRVAGQFLTDRHGVVMFAWEPEVSHVAQQLVYEGDRVHRPTNMLRLPRYN